jgi:hypothetical protein
LHRILHQRRFACFLLPLMATGVSIVVAQLSEEKGVPLHLVDHPMLIRDSTRPKACEGMFEWFGLAQASEWLALRFTNQFVDALNHPSVLLLPVQVILPYFIRED